MKTIDVRFTSVSTIYFPFDIDSIEDACPPLVQQGQNALEIVKKDILKSQKLLSGEFLLKAPEKIAKKEIDKYCNLVGQLEMIENFIKVNKKDNFVFYMKDEDLNEF